MSTPRLAAVVLAAGEGKRFKSSTPKVLHALCGRPLVGYVLTALEPLGATKTVLVISRGGDEVKAASKQLTDTKLTVALQEKQLGTADAARVGDDALGKFSGDVLVVPGDSPLLTSETLQSLIEHHRTTKAAATMLTADLDNPTGYGRVIRDAQGRVERIVEETDATPDEKMIAEANTSVWVFDRAALRSALTKIDRANAQKEFYLTDVVAVLRDKGETVEAVKTTNPTEVLGVNSRVQLADVSALMRRRIAEQHMLEGVTIIDPATTFIDAGVTIGRDTVIHPLTHLHGATSVGAGAELGPNVKLVDTTVGDEATVINTVGNQATIGARAQVGPFTYLRPGAVLKEGAKAGTYVEIKKSTIGKGSKVPHLSYVGDAEIGENVNIGAGTITCNYDGETGKKSKTVIGDDVLIGSDTMLVAPVTVGDGAVTGAGSVVSRDIPPGEVAIGAPARTVRKRKPKPKGGHKT
ncbi:MAG: bifunctional UDP-N-acetylglucosamine diphosphorylase/glucosamine-1-phosphate N-acetyltransferase GlmU [Actinomycetota bacterium]